MPPPNIFGPFCLNSAEYIVGPIITLVILLIHIFGVIHYIPNLMIIDENLPSLKKKNKKKQVLGVPQPWVQGLQCSAGHFDPQLMTSKCYVLCRTFFVKFPCIEQKSVGHVRGLQPVLKTEDFLIFSCFVSSDKKQRLN